MLKQTADLVVDHIDDETIVYDKATDRASNLNAAASKVFALCDGTLDYQGLCERMSESVGSDSSEAVVREALELLKEKGLVSGAVPDMPPNRRAFLKQALVKAAIAVPVIYSIVAPTPAAAISGPVSSDRRLKRDIALLGTLPSGVRVYRFRYLWSDTEYAGVLAQDLASTHPSAVSVGTDGFYRVDYASLGFTMVPYTEWLQKAEPILR